MATQWDQLEAINIEAMTANIVLPRITRVVTLQEHAQLNTLDELVPPTCSAKAEAYATQLARLN